MSRFTDNVMNITHSKYLHEQKQSPFAWKSICIVFFYVNDIK